ncbi:MAG: hypothetical protein WD407_07685, partial [Rhodospirillales bacterium]
MGKTLVHVHENALSARVVLRVGVLALAVLLCALPAQAKDLDAATQKLFEAVKKNDIAAVRGGISGGAAFCAR